VTNQKTTDGAKLADLSDADLDQVQGGYSNIAGLDQKAEKCTKKSDDGKRGDKTILAQSGDGSI